MGFITTIKLKKSTKKKLDVLKRKHETYDDTISELLSQSKEKNLEKELTEGYKNVGKEELKLLKEWEKSSPPIE